MATTPSGTFTFTPIATVRSGFADRTEIPKGPGASHTREGTIEVRADLEEALTDIEGFSHLYVIWVFDRGEPGFELMSQPPNADRPHGLFSTRTPRRPNPIALTVVELLGRDGATLRVRGLDMLDGTPVLDIKPYLSNIAAERLRRGWLDEQASRMDAAEPR
ncbi:MAG: tRNA (N6-threonylcarbamoyladenosine(37)-N6)-methyltransferase TrmO [Vicinamibacterales bacterium]